MQPSYPELPPSLKVFSVPLFRFIVMDFAARPIIAAVCSFVILTLFKTSSTSSFSESIMIEFENSPLNS